MEVAIMMEGQDGITWDIWKRAVRLVEDLGFAGLFRSDHFTNASPPDKDSLELWVSMTWLAANTSRIEFGPLVTPFSFRNPAFTARMGKDVNDLSGGRFVLGIGAGWQEREHTMFGFPLLEPEERFARFTEGAHIVHALLRSEGRVNFDGRYYQLRDAILLPRPEVAGGPRLLIGGNGEKKTLPLVARYCDEWNGVLIPPERYAVLNGILDGYLAEEGRLPNTVRRSLMTGLVFGRNDAELKSRLAGKSLDDLAARGIVVGTANAVRERLANFAEAGVQRIMLQWLELEDLNGLEALAKAVL